MPCEHPKSRPDPIGLTYYRRLFQLFRSYRKREAVVSAMPVRLWIELSARCNLQCVMCPNKDLDPGHKGEMEPEIFRKVIDEVKEFAFEVSLHHRGESLLHPQVAEMIDYAARVGLDVKLHTNGMLLDEKMAGEIVRSGLHRLSFSFDGFEAGDYEKIRRGGDFDRVVGNIRRILEIRNAQGKRRPVVAIELIRLSPGQFEKEKMKRFRQGFAGLHLDQVVIKNPHNWAGYLAPKHSRHCYSPCTFPWNALLVLFDGDVSPCSQDFFATYTVGNVREKSLREIWNDAPMQRLRRALAGGRYGEFTACVGCDRLWRDKFLGIPREYLKQLIFKKMP